MIVWDNTPDMGGTPIIMSGQLLAWIGPPRAFSMLLARVVYTKFWGKEEFEDDGPHRHFTAVGFYVVPLRIIIVK